MPRCLLSVAVCLLAITACKDRAAEPVATAPDEAVETKTGQADAEYKPLDLMLGDYDYPYEVGTHTFEAQGQSLQMAYMDVTPKKGVEATGKTALLLHGKNFSGAYWASTIEALRERGWRVIAPDQVGFGKSSKPVDHQFSFHALATYTAGLLDAIDADKVHVVGHSMGGMLATRFALMFPERTERLALVNPIGLEDWGAKEVPYKPVDWWYQNELGKTPARVEAYMTESYFDGEFKPAYTPLVELQAGWALADSPDKEILAKVSALTYDMIFTQPVVYEFDNLTVPTLLIIGTRDTTALGKPLVSEKVRATLGNYDVLGDVTAERIPDATLVELEGIGHIPQYESYEAYIKALTDFMATPAK